jgi:hypothetical protein
MAQATVNIFMNIEEIFLQVATYCDIDNQLTILSLNRYLANDEIVSRFLPKGLLSYLIPLRSHTLLSYYTKLKLFVKNLPEDNDPVRYRSPFRDWLVLVKFYQKSNNAYMFVPYYPNYENKLEGFILFNSMEFYYQSQQHFDEPNEYYVPIEDGFNNLFWEVGTSNELNANFSAQVWIIDIPNNRTAFWEPTFYRETPYYRTTMLLDPINPKISAGFDISCYGDLFSFSFHVAEFTTCDDMIQNYDKYKYKFISWLFR